MATLGSVCRFLNGGTPSKAVQSYFEGDIPWITSADISGPIANYARSFITEDAVRNSAVNKVAAGSVLLVTRTGVGKVATADKELCFSQDITALIPDKSKLDAGYLVHFLRTKKPHFLGLARGATIQGITRNVVSDLSIPLPPLAEQRRIAAILDQADALRAKRREALAQLDSLTQSIFIEMFGSKSNLSIRLFGEIAKLKRGPFGGALKKEIFVESGPMVFEQRHAINNDCVTGRYFISETKFREMEDFSVMPDDLIVSCSGTIGRVAIVPNNAPTGIINQALLRVRVNRELVTPLFVKYVLESDAVQQKLSSVSHGTGLQNFPPMSEVKSLEFPLPTISQQSLFSERIFSVERQKEIAKKSLWHLDSLFLSFQHRAFQGEL